MHMQK